MDIEEEISAAYTLIKRMRKRREKEKPHKEKTEVLKAEKRMIILAFALFHYLC